jgi:hypothetical protein
MDDRRKLEKLNCEIRAILADPKIKARPPNRARSMPMTPTQIKTLLIDETETSGKVVKFADLNAK